MPKRKPFARLGMLLSNLQMTLKQRFLEPLLMSISVIYQPLAIVFKKIDQSRIGRFIYWLRSLSFVKQILFYYVVITFVGALILFSPAARQANAAPVSFVDALFTSASAFSDTGLTPLTTASTWSAFGQAVIAIWILIGGIGWFALKIYFLNILLGRPMSFSSLDLVSSERGSSTKVGQSRRIIKISLTILFVLIIISGALLTLLFYFLPPSDNPYQSSLESLRGKNVLFENPQGNAELALRWGFFHAISAINNAGFDIMGGQSIAPYYNEYSIQIVFLVLFIIGGIGYPVIFDIYSFVVAKINRRAFRWSLFTKLSMITYVGVGLGGLLLAFLIETLVGNANVYDPSGAVSAVRYSFWNNPMYGSKGSKAMALVFNTLSTRNAGFSTIRIGDFTQSTMLIYSSMMFIGAAPSSTGGGIRTTTFALLLLGVWRLVRGKNEVQAFNRRVPLNTVSRSLVIFFGAIAVWALGTFGNYASSEQAGGAINQVGNLFQSYAFNSAGEQLFVSVPYSLNVLAFEAASAFGTTGLSIGITPYLATTSKIILIFVMFIGQLGLSHTLFVWRNRASKSKLYRFVEEDVVIG